MVGLTYRIHIMRCMHIMIMYEIMRIILLTESSAPSIHDEAIMIPKFGPARDIFMMMIREMFRPPKLQLYSM